jgi:hypothetical protein
MTFDAVIVGTGPAGLSDRSPSAGHGGRRW